MGKRLANPTLSKLLPTSKEKKKSKVSSMLETGKRKDEEGKVTSQILQAAYGYIIILTISYYS